MIWRHGKNTSDFTTLREDKPYEPLRHSAGWLSLIFHERF